MSKANSAKTRMIVFALTAALGLWSSAANIAARAGVLRSTASQASDDSATSPAAILSAARLLYVHSRTGLVKSEAIESELQKRTELQQAELLLTRDPRAADLILEVRRSNFTTEYPYVVIDRRTQVVVASGKVNSLFGTAAGKIAKGFAKQLRQARFPAANQPSERRLLQNSDATRRRELISSALENQTSIED